MPGKNMNLFSIGGQSRTTCNTIVYSTCMFLYCLFFSGHTLVKPDHPRIIRPVTSNSTFIGIRDVAVTLACLSTGGYPEQTVDWFKVRHGQMHIRLTTCTTSTRIDNGLYKVLRTCRFTPNYSDDGAIFSCQSSYSGKPQLQDSTDVQFEIARRSHNCFLKLIILMVLPLLIDRTVSVRVCFSRVTML